MQVLGVRRNNYNNNSNNSGRDGTIIFIHGQRDGNIHDE